MAPTKAKYTDVFSKLINNLFRIILVQGTSKNMFRRTAKRLFSASKLADNDAVVVSFARTPIGNFKIPFMSYSHGSQENSEVLWRL